MIVEWEDSKLMEHGWECKDSIEPIRVKCCSFGLLVKEAKDSIMVYENLSGIRVVGGVTIPKTAITRIRRLKVEG